jgi:chitodextrinase
MTTVDLTRADVDLDVDAGDDIALRFVFVTDATQSTNASFESTWSASVAYTVDQIVEVSGVFYQALVNSTNVTPAGNAATWRPLTVLDLTGYTAWKAAIRTSEVDSAPFTIDATLQASSIISASLAGVETAARAFVPRVWWDLQVTDPNGKVRTLYGGKVCITPDATR